MPRFRYGGPDPVPDDDGGMVRPGEVREMGAEPPWGPWVPVPDEAEAAPGPAAAPSPRRSATSTTASAQKPSPGKGE